MPFATHLLNKMFENTNPASIINHALISPFVMPLNRFMTGQVTDDWKTLRWEWSSTTSRGSDTNPNP